MKHEGVQLETKKLRTIMAKRFMGQNGLARLAKLSTGHVSQLINGTRHASPKIQKKLLRCLGVEFDAIFRVC